MLLELMETQTEEYRWARVELGIREVVSKPQLQKVWMLASRFVMGSCTKEADEKVKNRALNQENARIERPAVLIYEISSRPIYNVSIK